MAQIDQSILTMVVVDEVPIVIPTDEVGVEILATSAEVPPPSRSLRGNMEGGCGTRPGSGFILLVGGVSAANE